MCDENATLDYTPDGFFFLTLLWITSWLQGSLFSGKTARRKKEKNVSAIKIEIWFIVVGQAIGDDRKEKKNC